MEDNYCRHHPSATENEVPVPMMWHWLHWTRCTELFYIAIQFNIYSYTVRIRKMLAFEMRVYSADPIGRGHVTYTLKCDQELKDGVEKWTY